MIRRLLRRPSPLKRQARRSGRGALTVVAGLLIASALVRLGDGTGAVLAREALAFATAASAASPERLAAAEDEAGFAALLSAVRAREARVAEEEARLEARGHALDIAGAEVEKNLAALAEAEARLADLLNLADTAADEDVARLTAMYEAMKPAAAGALFAQMDPAFAAGFLGRMRADAAAQILASLPPDRAYALSIVLAGRNAAAKAEGG